MGVNSCEELVQNLSDRLPGFGLVSIPEGVFEMGSLSEVADEDEQPTRLVYLDNYCLMDLSVTVGQFATYEREAFVIPNPTYRLLVKTEGCGLKGNTSVEPIEEVSRESVLSHVLLRGGKVFVDKQEVCGFEVQEDQSSITDISGRVVYQNQSDPQDPVTGVSWEMADAFCKHYGMVLPTEAQWEYAARGPQSLELPNGCDYGSASCMEMTSDINGANSQEVGIREAGKVGSYLPNGFGLYDVSGNVWQWVADWYGPYTDLPEGDVDMNPTGPETGGYRVLRGGSYLAWLARAAYRNYDYPGVRVSSGGFRCAR